MEEELKLVAEGTEDISGIDKHEHFFNEFDSGEVRVYYENNLSTEQIKQIEDRITADGVVLTGPVIQDAGVLVIPFRKEIAPLLIIGLAVAGLGAGFFGWQIFKGTQIGIPIWVWFVGGAALLYLFFQSQAGKAATGTVIKAGKVYVTKKAME